MIATSFFVISSLFAIASGKPVARAMQVHESIEKLPAGFKSKGQASPDEMLNLRIALVQNDATGLIEKLMDISSPISANYGQWLSREEVRSMARVLLAGHMFMADLLDLVQTERFTAPSSQSYAAVTSWLKENGLAATNLSTTGQWLSVSLPVKQANSLFDADFKIFNHESSNTDLVRTLSYSVPSDLKGDIDIVHPTTALVHFFVCLSSSPISFMAFFFFFRFVAGISSGPTVTKEPRKTAPKARDEVDDSCGSTITPTCLQELYGIPSDPANQTANVLGVSGYVEEWISDEDLQVSGIALF